MDPSFDQNLVVLRHVDKVGPFRLMGLPISGGHGILKDHLPKVGQGTLYGLFDEPRCVAHAEGCERPKDFERIFSSTEIRDGDHTSHRRHRTDKDLDAVSGIDVDVEGGQLFGVPLRPSYKQKIDVTYVMDT